MAKFPKRSPDERALRSTRSRSGAAGTAWEEQAQWYDARQGKEGDDFHRDLVLPAVLRQLRAQAGQTVLDCCCGNGVLGRHLASTGVKTIGVDASPHYWRQPVTVLAIWSSTYWAMPINCLRFGLWMRVHVIMLRWFWRPRISTPWIKCLKAAPMR